VLGQVSHVLRHCRGTLFLILHHLLNNFSVHRGLVRLSSCLLDVKPCHCGNVFSLLGFIQ
jgi:hypothetical protein